MRILGADLELEQALALAVRRRLAVLRRCYEMQRRTHPEWTARVHLSGRLDANGRFTEVTPDTEDRFVRCAAHFLRTLHVANLERTDGPLVRIALGFGVRLDAPQNPLNRRALGGLLEEARVTIEECARREHRVTQVNLRLVVRPDALARVRSVTRPRSRVMERCIDDALQSVAARAKGEYLVESTVRTRAEWRVQSRAARRASMGEGLAIGHVGAPH